MILIAKNSSLKLWVLYTMFWMEKITRKGGHNICSTFIRTNSLITKVLIRGFIMLSTIMENKNKIFFNIFTFSLRSWWKFMLFIFVFRHGISVLSVRILVDALRKALVNRYRCAVNTGIVFKNCTSRVFLWCAFQSVVKIVSNLSIFTLHQTRWYVDGAVFHCFILYLCTQNLWFENLDNA